jgi:PAS domain S-box-containing protein
MAAAERSKSNSSESDGQPAEQAAKEFFPNFATVRAALEAGQIGVWCWDIASNTVTWSSNLETIHGMQAGSFDGTYAGFENDIRGDDQANVAAVVQEALRTRVPYRARYRTSPREGREERWLESSGVVDVKDGAPQRMLGLCHDVTERVNLENELRSRIKQQEALAQLGERALAEPDLERLLGDAVSTVALTLAVDFVKILELLPGNVELRLRAGFGWKTNLVGTVLASTEANTYTRHTLDSLVPVVTDDFAVETRFAIDAYLQDHNCVSGMNVTIAGRDDRAYGILGVCTAKKRRFAAQDTAFLAAVANLLAGAIQRRQLE